jgi:pyrrolidone-carboxylate peptidase
VPGERVHLKWTELRFAPVRLCPIMATPDARVDLSTARCVTPPVWCFRHAVGVGKRTMGAKFCFFTDPAALAAQSPAEAFGPELIPSTGTSKDRFRVTDTHHVTIPMVAKAYAVCRGQICVQAAGAGSLALVLRPLVPPPFDFPYVEYYIYRGIRADSLLASNGKLDLGKEGAGATLNNLIAYIREKVLKHAAPQTTTESSAHLGLDRTATTATDGGDWGDGQPLDHLFRYPGGAELPIVEAGWTLGGFDATFGFEVVVQQYGAQPTIGWARNADPWIEADKTSTGASAADLYASRLQREAIGCFVDPCAFWGMFWRDGLTIAGEGTKKANHLHAQLFGASPGIFANRGRAWLDIRNKVGLSYDFYGIFQDAIQTGPDEAGLTQVSYSSSGWPVHHVDPAPPALCFRLARKGPTAMLFLRQTGRPTPRDPFETVHYQAPPQWTSAVTFKRPKKAGHRPPWWFVAHYLTGDAGTAGTGSSGGVFDTSTLEFGPIGDRVVATFREMWPTPPTGGPQPGPTGYDRLFVSDKVLRYDAARKVDPVDAHMRDFSYDHVGETHYVFQRGFGANHTKDSVMIVQRADFRNMSTYDAQQWIPITPSEVRIPTTTGIFFRSLTGEMLPTPVATKIPPNLTVASFAELQSDSHLLFKFRIFDLTVLLLSRNVFATLLGPILSGPPPGPGEAHPTYLSIAFVLPILEPWSYSLERRSWNGQPDVGAASEPVHTADGIFFSSADFDQDAITIAAREPTVEESDASKIWDGVLPLDTLGNSASDRMASLASAFIDALPGIDAASQNAQTDLLALVGQYAAAIWNRAVALAGDPQFECWSDRILYYARLKMEVALKNHPLLLADAAAASELIDRFESLSRNYSGLIFTDAAAGDERVIVTGFDPFGAPGTATIKDSNPSGRLALYLAANRTWTKSSTTFFVSTCIFPVRWADFDRQVVEKTLQAALSASSTDPKPVALLCTVSLDDRIGKYVETYPNPVLYCKIEGFAAHARGNQPDNLGVKSAILSPSTLPVGTSKNFFFETTLNSRDLSDYDSQFMKVRYDWRFDAKNGAQTVRHPSLVPHSTNYDDTSGQTVWSPPLDPTAAAVSLTSAIYGSGGNYLSNEVYYRSANLLRAKFSSVKSGHIHVPQIRTYTKTDATTFTVTVEHVAEAVLAVIGGEL